MAANLQKKNGGLYCGTCHETIANDERMVIHRSTKAHHRMIERNFAGSPSLLVHHCDACEATVASMADFRAHINTDGHRTRMGALQRRCNLRQSHSKFVPGGTSTSQPGVTKRSNSSGGPGPASGTLSSSANSSLDDQASSASSSTTNGTAPLNAGTSIIQQLVAKGRAATMTEHSHGDPTPRTDTSSSHGRPHGGASGGRGGRQHGRGFGGNHLRPQRSVTGANTEPLRPRAAPTSAVPAASSAATSGTPITNGQSSGDSRSVSASQHSVAIVLDGSDSDTDAEARRRSRIRLQCQVRLQDGGQCGGVVPLGSHYCSFHSNRAAPDAGQLAMADECGSAAPILTSLLSPTIPAAVAAPAAANRENNDADHGVARLTSNKRRAPEAPEAAAKRSYSGTSANAVHANGGHSVGSPAEPPLERDMSRHMSSCTSTTPAADVASSSTAGAAHVREAAAGADAGPPATQPPGSPATQPPGPPATQQSRPPATQPPHRPVAAAQVEATVRSNGTAAAPPDRVADHAGHLAGIMEAESALVHKRRIVAIEEVRLMTEMDRLNRQLMACRGEFGKIDMALRDLNEKRHAVLSSTIANHPAASSLSRPVSPASVGDRPAAAVVSTSSGNPTTATAMPTAEQRQQPTPETVSSRASSPMPGEPTSAGRIKSEPMDEISATPNSVPPTETTEVVAIGAASAEIAPIVHIGSGHRRGTRGILSAAGPAAGADPGLGAPSSLAARPGTSESASAPAHTGPVEQNSGFNQEQQREFFRQQRIRERLEWQQQQQQAVSPTAPVQQQGNGSQQVPSSQVIIDAEIETPELEQREQEHQEEEERLGQEQRDQQQRERERNEQERHEREQREREQSEREQREREQREQEKREQEKRELERRELGKREQEKREQEKREQEKREQEKREQEKREQEKREQEKREQEKREQEKREQEKREQEKREQEKREQEKREQEKREQEKGEQEKREQEKREQERRELEKREQEKREQERREQERREQEKRDQERRDQERRDQERRDRERREKERREQERRDKERREQERRDRERKERERKEEDRRDRERRDKERKEEQERQDKARREKERHERERSEKERRDHPREDRRRDESRRDGVESRQRQEGRDPDHHHHHEQESSAHCEREHREATLKEKERNQTQAQRNHVPPSQYSVLERVVNKALAAVAQQSPAAPADRQAGQVPEALQATKTPDTAARTPQSSASVANTASTSHHGFTPYHSPLPTVTNASQLLSKVSKLKSIVQVVQEQQSRDKEQRSSSAPCSPSSTDSLSLTSSPNQHAASRTSQRSDSLPSTMTASSKSSANEPVRSEAHAPDASGRQGVAASGDAVPRDPRLKMAASLKNTPSIASAKPASQAAPANSAAAASTTAVAAAAAATPEQHRPPPESLSLSQRSGQSANNSVRSSPAHSPHMSPTRTQNPVVRVAQPAGQAQLYQEHQQQQLRSANAVQTGSHAKPSQQSHVSTAVSSPHSNNGGSHGAARSPSVPGQPNRHAGSPAAPVPPVSALSPVPGRAGVANVTPATNGTVQSPSHAKTLSTAPASAPPASVLRRTPQPQQLAPPPVVAPPTAIPPSTGSSASPGGARVNVEQLLETLMRSTPTVPPAARQSSSTTQSVTSTASASTAGSACGSHASSPSTPSAAAPAVQRPGGVGLRPPPPSPPLPTTLSLQSSVDATAGQNNDSALPEGQAQASLPVARTDQATAQQVQAPAAAGNGHTTQGQTKSTGVLQFKIGKINAHKQPVSCIKYYGGLMFTASEDKMCYAFEQASGKRVRSFEGHRKGITCMEVFEVSKEPKRVYLMTACNDSSLRLYNAGTAECLAQYKLDCRVLCMVMGNGVLYAGRVDGKVNSLRCDDSLVQNSSDLCEHVIHPSSKISAMCMAEVDGEPCLVSGCFNQVVSVWNVRQLNKARMTMTNVSQVVLCLQAVGNELYSGGNDHYIRVHDLKTGIQLRSMEHPQPVSSLVAVRSRGKSIVFSGCLESEGFIRCFNGQSCEKMQAYGGLYNRTFSLCLVSNAMIVGCRDGTIHTLLIKLNQFFVCKWRDCDFKWALGDRMTFVQHMRKHSNDPTTCRWENCNENLAGMAKKEVLMHLQKHIQAQKIQHR